MTGIVLGIVLAAILRGGRMKFPLAAAAAFACIMALPAKAQGLVPASFEGNDWWLVAPGGDKSAAVLSNGAPRQSGGKAVLWLIGLFPGPGSDGATGIALSVIIDCDTRGGEKMEPFTLDANGEFKRHETIVDHIDPLPVTSPFYRFACTGDRTGMRHFPNRSRREVIAEIRARTPGH